MEWMILLYVNYVCNYVTDSYSLLDLLGNFPVMDEKVSSIMDTTRYKRVSS